MADERELRGNARGAARTDRAAQSYYLSRDEAQRLEAAAQRQGLSKSYLVRQAVTRFLGEEAKR